MIRPVITNFASGELDPRLEGRIDLPMVAAGARELTNFFPSRLGGAFKRGALKYLLGGISNSKKMRLIPWSLSATTDLLIAISDGKLRIIDVSGGKTPSYLTTNGTTVLEIVYMDGQSTTPVLTMYADRNARGIDEVSSVYYSQNKDTIVLTQKDHPPFYIKVNDVSTATNTISITYGRFSLFGNVAYNAPGQVDDVDLPISSQAIADALTNLVSAQAYNCDPGSFVYVGASKKMLKTVANTYVTGVSNIKIYSDPTKATLEYTLNADSSNVLAKRISYPCAITTTRYTHNKVWGFMAGGIAIANGATYQSIYAQLANTITERTKAPPIGIRYGTPMTYYAWVGDPGDTPPAPAVAHAYPDAKLKTLVMTDTPSSYSIVMTYYDYTITVWQGSLGSAPIGPALGWAYKNTADGKMYWHNGSAWIEMTTTATITPTSATPMDLSCSIVMASQGIAINGSNLYGTIIFDAVAPWMKRDEEYQCHPDFKLNGVAPQTAKKTMSGDVEVILLTYPNSAGSQIITRETEGLTGQLGVIVTPLYTSNPQNVCQHQGRQVFAASGNILFLSKPNDASNFSFFESIQYDTTALKPASDWNDPLVPETKTLTDITQQVGAGSGMRLEVATEENEDIRWMISVGDLIVGTSTTEWIIPSGVNAMNPQIIQTSRSGSAALQARFIGSSIVFIGGTGKSVKMYDPKSRGSAPDISEQAAHMFTGKIVAFDFRQNPTEEMYFVLDSGIALRLVLSNGNPQWSRLKTSDDGLFEGVAVISDPLEDAVYFTLARMIGGSEIRTIERLITSDDSTFANRGHLDCASYIASTTATITIPRFASAGTNSLRVVFRAGGVESRGTATPNGSGAFSTYTDSILGAGIAVPVGAEAWVGFGFSSRLETFRIDDQDTEGLEKGGSSLHIRLFKSGTFKIMRGYDPTDTVGYTVDLPDGQVYPYSGPRRIELDAPTLVDQSIIIQSDDDQAVNVLVLAPAYSVAVTP